MSLIRIYDIISKKREGGALTKEEIEFAVQGYTSGRIPDFQMAALLMAICIKGMTDEETANLTMSMANSGDIIDLSQISGIKVDKHSTGGVGDKTTLIVTPIVASCGVNVAKLSGRALGHTGGTIDKLESITGYRTDIPQAEFLRLVQDIGVSVIGQSASIAPADKKIYSLRDQTATVESIPLIASSIMSKKIASGADAIVLDVKTGSGAFMKEIDDAIMLAKKMVAIGDNVGRKTVALVTDMNIPLGNAIGTSLEVIESAEILQGRGDDRLRELCTAISSNMLHLAGKGSIVECERMVEDSINNGSAFEKLCRMAHAQGGDDGLIRNTDKFPKAQIIYPLKAHKSGYITDMDTQRIGISALLLGAGRQSMEEQIDFSAGIMLSCRTGDYVECGDVLATLHTNSEDRLKKAKEVYLGAIEFSDEKPIERDIILKRIGG